MRNAHATAPHRVAGHASVGEAPATWGDLAAGLGGLGIMALAAATPWRRGRRQRWGVSEAVAARTYPGDALVPAPTWMWTHGVEVAAPAAAVWPWLAQVGADRGGFYSYSWLENLAGCRLCNADAVHPEWTVREGDGLLLHPRLPPLRIAGVQPGRWFVAHGPAEPAARGRGRGWVEVSWLFHIEPLPRRRCRVVSRYRCATAPDLRTRLAFGPLLVEPVSFAMDRRMLLGIRDRAERARQH